MPEASQKRQEWLAAYDQYLINLGESRKRAAVKAEQEKAKKAALRAQIEEEQRSPKYWQQRKAEEDYSRGYDDGRFAYSEGFRGMPNEDEESEEYMNGFEDAQQEAAEEEADEKSRK